MPRRCWGSRRRDWRDLPGSDDPGYVETAMQRLRFLVWKEFLELRKDPKLFGIVVIAPMLQLTLLGYAATTDVRDVPVVVADGDRSPGSRELIARFDGSRNFNVISVVSTSNEVEPYLEHGDAW